MIVSASYRTDIPAFYERWFLRRLEVGEAVVRNPYSRTPYQVSLLPQDVDGFVFWTRNAAPFQAGLQAVSAMGRPFVVQYTVTGYPSLLEPGVPPLQHASAVIAGLANEYGRACTVWRYDPIVFSTLTPPDWHRRQFGMIAASLSDAVDEVTVSFAHYYKKSVRNLRRLTGSADFAWTDPPDDEKSAFIRSLAAIAEDYGLRLTICSQPHLEQSGIAGASCIDAHRLSAIAGRPITAKQKGNRAGCLCAESRDIGAYDSCAHGCVYCYAVRDHAVARTAVKDHSDQAPGLRL